VPKRVITISNEAFNDCKQLKEVTFEKDGDLESIGSGAFGGCTALEKVSPLINVLVSKDDFPEHIRDKLIIIKEM
jgi:hypothetical protein